MRLPAPSAYEQRAVADRPAYTLLLLVFVLHVSLGSFLQRTNLPFGIAYGELLFFAAIPWIATVAMSFRPRWFFALRWPRPGAWPWIAVAALAGFVFAGGTNTLNHYLVGPELAQRFDSTAIFQGRPWAERLALALGVTFLAPLGEEILFRGYLLRILGARYGALGGLLVTSALFALAHFNPASLLPLFALGCLFGLLRLLSGSLLPALAAHAIQNGTTAWLVLSGMAEETQGEMELLPALLLIAISTPVLWFTLARIEPARSPETSVPEDDDTTARDHRFGWGRILLPYLLAWLALAAGSVALLFLLS